MTIRAVEFVVEATGSRSVVKPPSPVELDVDSVEDFTSSVATQRPVAYIVRNLDLRVLRGLSDVTLDLGTKHKSRSLSAVLFHKKQIPFVKTTYEQAGRVRQGVEGLLARAVRAGERNAYIVGADDEVFEALWGGDSGHRRGRKSSAGSTIRTFISTREQLERIPKRVVPEELRARWYVGAAPQVELVRQRILMAGEVDEPVLIIGPTGSGKENVARSIHLFGTRKERPFVAVNTASISSTLFERELFGHVKGAFTDAKTDKPGFWEAAEDGTLFLDEIGDLDLDLQKKILRALDNGEILRVGSTKPIGVMARVVTATNRDLFSMVQDSQFRDDLYYRLRGILIRTPALHEHPEDIAELSQFLWRRITKDLQARLPAEVIARLEGYRWPGNVRELHAVLVHLYLVFRKTAPSVNDLELVFALQGQTPIRQRGESDGREVLLHRAECLRHLRQADEIIRACEVTLRPVVEKKGHDVATIAEVHRTLQNRLHELDVLCLHPLLFHSGTTFDAVNRLKGKLEYFHDLLQQSPAAATRYFGKEVSSELKAAVSAIFKEVERVMG